MTRLETFYRVWLISVWLLMGHIKNGATSSFGRRRRVIIIVRPLPELMTSQLGSEYRQASSTVSSSASIRTPGHLDRPQRSAIHSSIILAVLFRRDCVLLYCRPGNKTFCAEIGLAAWVVGLSLGPPFVRERRLSV